MNLPPCPVHSFFKRSHPELREDTISRPILLLRHPGRVYIINGCQHSHGLFGPHPSQEVAEALWGGIVERLEADMSDAKKTALAEYEGRLKVIEKAELPEIGQHELLR